MLINYFNEKKRIKKMDNGLVFTGTIDSIKKSTNHSFSIFYLSGVSSNINIHFGDTVNILPYKLKDNYAEVYTICGVDDYTGCKCNINSNLKIFTIKTLDNKMDTLNIQIVNDETDFNFIRANTNFNH